MRAWSASVAQVWRRSCNRICLTPARRTAEPNARVNRSGCSGAPNWRDMAPVGDRADQLGHRLPPGSLARNPPWCAGAEPRRGVATNVDDEGPALAAPVHMTSHGRDVSKALRACRGIIGVSEAALRARLKSPVDAFSQLSWRARRGSRTPTPLAGPAGLSPGLGVQRAQLSLCHGL